MAIQHVSVKNGARGNGAKHAQYIGREGRFGEQDDVLFVEDRNLPKWAANAVEFFAAADEFERDPSSKMKKTIDGIEYEKHVRGRAYKEVEAAIPREAKDPVQWAKDYAHDLLGEKHSYRLAVHDKEAKDGGRNVHMHLMFSTRTMDGYDREKERFFKRANNGTYKVKGETRQHAPGSGGAAKSKYWDSRDSIGKTRETFERHVQRVVPSFKLERSDAPEQKIGPKLAKAGPKYDRQREERLANVSALREAKTQRRDLDTEIKREKEIEARLMQAKASGEAERKQAAPNTVIHLGTDIEAAKKQAQPRSRTDELFAQLMEAKPSERERPVKGKEDPFAEFFRQQQEKAEQSKPKRDEFIKTTLPQKEPRMTDQDKAIGQTEQVQKEQQREEVAKQEQPAKPRSRTDELFEQLEKQMQERSNRDRDGGPDWSR